MLDADQSALVNDQGEIGFEGFMNILREAGQEIKTGNYEKSLLLLEEFLKLPLETTGGGPFEASLRARVEGNITSVKIMMARSEATDYKVKETREFEYKLTKGDMNFNRIQQFNEVVLRNYDEQKALNVLQGMYTGLENAIRGVQFSAKSCNHERLLKHLRVYHLFKNLDYSSLGTIYALNDHRYLTLFYLDLAYLCQREGLMNSAEIYYQKYCDLI